MLNFVAQFFPADATPLHDVGKISLAPPPYKNPGSAPGNRLHETEKKSSIVVVNKSIFTGNLGKFTIPFNSTR